MKPLFLTLIIQSLLASYLLATPERNSVTNEEYLGSNQEVYALMRTVTDNQGSYYSSRETKSLYEYSKLENTLISSELVSDIIYHIDAGHQDPNTSPKITKEILATNKKLFLSVLTSNYRKTTQQHNPKWVNRLTWKPDGLYLDEKLLILSKAQFTTKQIAWEETIQKPVSHWLRHVYLDHDCIYLSLKHGNPDDTQNKVLRISPERSKQIQDWATMLEEYQFISKHDTRDLANTAGLELIKSARLKKYYSLNLEIWSSHEPNSNSKTIYKLVHCPFEFPMKQSRKKRLNQFLGIETQPLKSHHFIEKWIPYSAPTPPEETEMNK